MPSSIEEISLTRFEDRIVVSYCHGHKDKYGGVEHRTGELESEDIEDSYIGALKSFFNNSEVWNE